MRWQSAALLFFAFNDKCLLFIAAIIREDSLISEINLPTSFQLRFFTHNVWLQLPFWAQRLQLSAVVHICRQNQPAQRRFLFLYRDYTAGFFRAKVGYGHSNISRLAADGDDFRKAVLLFLFRTIYVSPDTHPYSHLQRCCGDPMPWGLGQDHAV